MRKDIFILVCFFLLFVVYTLFYISFLFLRYKGSYILFFDKNYVKKSSDFPLSFSFKNSDPDKKKENISYSYDLKNKEKEINFKIRELNNLKNNIFEILKSDDNSVKFDMKKMKNSFLLLLEDDISDELKNLEEKKINDLNNRLEEITSKIICSALERYSSKLVFSKTVNYLKINNKDDINRIIGKGGRNIDFFNKITGTKIVINNGSSLISDTISFIQISSFNPLRRKIAENTLKLSIDKSNFSPMQIEKNFEEVKKNIDLEMRNIGEKVVKELELNNFHEELIRKIGILEYRTSYGQNVLEHSVEVAKLCGSIAGELGLDKYIARRAGLLHDIGKAMEDDEDIDHVSNGFNLARKCNESPLILNAIASHHKEEECDNFYSLIVIAADKLSAARPGSRSYQIENYIERMKNIEKVIDELPGVKQCYVFQAGREI